jgi:cellulose synthase/poly-beta-1,6-N-acetylglucosamine synthase-like glycosyltransferase
MILFDLILWLLVAAIAIPVTVFIVEVCLSMLGSFLPSRHMPDSIDLPTLNVVVPAHNESQIIGRTLKALAKDISATRRIVVVADNCTDETAEVARSYGVTVLERHNLDQRGKGYALAAALDSLRADPPDVVVFLDADCQVEPGAMPALVRATAQAGRPSQLVYLLSPPPKDDYRAAVSWLAMTFKNCIRPRGLKRLGGPCQIMGTGFAMPWPLIDQVEFASGNIVEDMQLGIDLALVGSPPEFCETGHVLSDMAPTDSAAETQRTRWEHGHMQTLVTQVPRLLGAFVRRLDPRLLLMALDLAVPPLSLLVFGWLAATIVCVGAALLGANLWPAVLLAGLGVGLMLCVLAGWYRFARDTITMNQLLAIPSYVLWKIPIYLRFLTGRQTTWVRTERK